MCKLHPFNSLHRPTCHRHCQIAIKRDFWLRHNSCLLRPTLDGPPLPLEQALMVQWHLNCGIPKLVINRACKLPFNRYIRSVGGMVTVLATVRRELLSRAKRVGPRPGPRCGHILTASIGLWLWCVSQAAYFKIDWTSREMRVERVCLHFFLCWGGNTSKNVRATKWKISGTGRRMSLVTSWIGKIWGKGFTIPCSKSCNSTQYWVFSSDRVIWQL